MRGFADMSRRGFMSKALKMNSFSSLANRQLTSLASRSFGFESVVKQETFFAKDLIIEKKKEHLPKPGDDHVYTFGGLTTDYMLEIDYDKQNGGW